MQHLRAPFVRSAFAIKRATVALGVSALSALFIAGSQASAQEQESTTGYNLGSSGTATQLSFDDWVARSTIVVAGTDPFAALYSTPKGTGYDAVAALFIQRPDGNFICSGALLAGGLNVLTAAHCLSNAQGVNIATSVTTVFFTPGQPASARQLIASSSTLVNPAYTGEIIDAHDVAIVRLAAAPTQSILDAAYTLYLGNPFGQTAQLVGSGATGVGATGATIDGGFTLADRRTGFNTVNFSLTDPQFNGFFTNHFFGNADIFGLVADFDNGTAANNAACIITSLPQFSWTTPTCGGGFGVNEVGLGGGDSGGPLFIGNQIAGVASYGLSFGSAFGDVDTVFNASFGEFSGWSSTAYNAAWITSVPEPSSFALVGVGLFALVGIAKRRNRVS